MNGLVRVDHVCVAGSGGDHLACFAGSKDYIGPDPVKWVERLLDVNDDSHFTAHQKRLINNCLIALRMDLS